MMTGEDSLELVRFAPRQISSICIDGKECPNVKKLEPSSNIKNYKAGLGRKQGEYNDQCSWNNNVCEGLMIDATGYIYGQKTLNAMQCILSLFGRQQGGSQQGNECQSHAVGKSTGWKRGKQNSIG